DEPSVNEVNVALFPALVITLYGKVPERTLVRHARELRDALEGLAGVLEVDIAGDREDLVEVLIDPERLAAYDQPLENVLGLVGRNNQLVAAGALDTGQGRFAVKVPGVFEDIEDVTGLPLVAEGERVVNFGDVATIRRTFKDPEGFARVDGQPAVTLEVVKRIGANIIDTLDRVKSLVAEHRAGWPESIRVSYSQDKSEDIRTMLGDLQNNVIAAVALVMIVIIAVLGARAAGLVGVAIPGSFLAGILVLALGGLTINIVVLFSLIMAVGMLVDGAIVVVELADRKMAEGLPRREAYRIAARRMAWPIIASTATTLAAFMPLLFWPGVVGEFMKYLPITLIATLTASLAMALIFVPTLGSLIGRRAPDAEARSATLAAAEQGDLDTIGGFTGGYLALLDRALRRPGRVALLVLLLLVGAYSAYAHFGHGVEFFPEIEPEQAVLHVRARGDLSVSERDALLRAVEARILGMPEFATVYARSGDNLRGGGGGGELPEDTIGVIQLEFVDWQQRRPAAEILTEVRARTADLAGLLIEARKQQAGPGAGKPVQLRFGARQPELLPAAVERVL
ncbi:MAG: efflux RND transporter permease subunit, partial [Candidatus Competibacterales bacterium]|nr:efflux RND transporter permease subunit [Candidatus Competibacterales bacterium]